MKLINKLLNWYYDIKFIWTIKEWKRTDSGGVGKYEFIKK